MLLVHCSIYTIRMPISNEKRKSKFPHIRCEKIMVGRQKDIGDIRWYFAFLGLPIFPHCVREVQQSSGKASQSSGNNNFLNKTSRKNQNTPETKSKSKLSKIFWNRRSKLWWVWKIKTTLLWNYSISLATFLTCILRNQSILYITPRIVGCIITMLWNWWMSSLS